MFDAGRFLPADPRLGFRLRAELCSPSPAAGGWGTLHHQEKTAHALEKQGFGKGRDESSPDVLRGRAVLSSSGKCLPGGLDPGMCRALPLPTCCWPHLPTDRAHLGGEPAGSRCWSILQQQGSGISSHRHEQGQHSRNCAGRGWEEMGTAAWDIFVQGASTRGKESGKIF